MDLNEENKAIPFPKENLDNSLKLQCFELENIYLSS